LSLSIGVARFDPKKAVTLGELLAQADQAMYEKKRKSKMAGKTGI
jgi:GGDEF domain-containing protein